MNDTKSVIIAALAAILMLGLSAAQPERINAGTAEQEALARCGEPLHRALQKEANPAEAFGKLDASEQRCVKVYLKNEASTTTTETVRNADLGDTGVGIQAIRCWTWTNRVKGYNVIGHHLWTYSQQKNWCDDGSLITDTSRRRWGEVHALFWGWEHRDSETSGGVGRYYTRHFTQGEFKLCIVGGNIGCVQHSYPWIDSTGYANGRGSWEWGT